MHCCDKALGHAVFQQDAFSVLANIRTVITGEWQSCLLERRRQCCSPFRGPPGGTVSAWPCPLVPSRPLYSSLTLKASRFDTYIYAALACMLHDRLWQIPYTCRIAVVGEAHMSHVPKYIPLRPRLHTSMIKKKLLSA